METIISLREEVKSMIDNADEKVLRMLYAMLITGEEKDWWDELTDEDKKEIEDAIGESEKEANFIPFRTFQSEFNKWRTELLSSKEQTKK